MQYLGKWLQACFFNKNIESPKLCWRKNNLGLFRWITTRIVKLDQHRTICNSRPKYAYRISLSDSVPNIHLEWWPVLYCGRDVFILPALTILLAFLVSPLVSRLKHWGYLPLGRDWSGHVSNFIFLGGAATYLGVKLGKLSQELPQYQDTIQQKLNILKW